MNRKAGWAATAGVIAAGAAYQFMIYRAAHGGLPLWVRVLLKSLPLLLFAWWAITRPRHRTVAVIALGVAAAALFWVDLRGFGGLGCGSGRAHFWYSLEFFGVR